MGRAGPELKSKRTYGEPEASPAGRFGLTVDLKSVTRRRVICCLVEVRRKQKDGEMEMGEKRGKE